MRVLVVEDEIDVADVFRDYLTELGHTPTVVRTAEAALGTLEQERPDAILLDLKLPGMSGLEFLRLGRTRAANVPVVAVSGAVTERQVRECLELGAVDFVGKPVVLDRLSAVLRYLEPGALERTWIAAPADRRRAPRVPIRVPVLVIEPGGSPWHAMSIDVSVSGLKVRPRAPVTAGRAARLTFTPPDGGRPLTLMSALVRQDADELTFAFVNPTADEIARLASLVRSGLRG